LHSTEDSNIDNDCKPVLLMFNVCRFAEYQIWNKCLRNSVFTFNENQPVCGPSCWAAPPCDEVRPCLCHAPACVLHETRHGKSLTNICLKSLCRDM